MGKSNKSRSKYCDFCEVPAEKLFRVSTTQPPEWGLACKTCHDDFKRHEPDFKVDTKYKPH